MGYYDRDQSIKFKVGDVVVYYSYGTNRWHKAIVVSPEDTIERRHFIVDVTTGGRINVFISELRLLEGNEWRLR